MEFFNKEEIKQQLIEFTINGVESFLKKHPNLEFYAFAYDCDAEEGEVNLCFNTEEDFENTLHHSQNGRFAEHYQTEEAIVDLKFNTGNWEYQCFESINVLSHERTTEIYNELSKKDEKGWSVFVEDLMVFFSECLLKFTETETYKKIPKTNNFIAFCIDHDEDFEDSIERMEKIKL